MHKISILMNCYNGEAYLREALDSVFSQRFHDWKIVFIDNCSTDRSVDILNSYDTEKVEYFKTKENIPFGAARNYGLQKCTGEYIAFLDVDDVYHDNTLQILLNEIEGSDYLLVYGGHNNINSAGESIGLFLPSAKQGSIFRELLLQFDVPTASTMINRERFHECQLSYDSNMQVSAEYCLFLQLSVKNNFKSLEEAIVKYRIHSGSLTSKKLKYLYDDRIYTLNKIIEENDGIQEEYNSEFQEAFARADYYKVQHLLSVNKKKEARKLLRKHLFQDARYFFLNALLYMPSPIWNFILNKKYSR